MAAHGIDFAAEDEIQVGVDPGRSSPDVVTVLICESSILHAGLQRVLAGTAFRLTERVSAAFLGSHRDVAEAPALLIIDANRYSARMAEITEQVKGRFPQARLVALADQFDFRVVPAWYEAGIDGFCLVASRSEVLINSLELVMLGESALPSTVADSMLGQRCSSPNPQSWPGEVATEAMLADLRGRKLTLREVEILRGLTSGDSNKVIARRLDIAEATIKVHVKTILRKTGLTNRTQVALWAIGHLPSTGDACADSGADRS